MSYWQDSQINIDGHFYQKKTFFVSSINAVNAVKTLNRNKRILCSPAEIDITELSAVNEVHYLINSVLDAKQSKKSNGHLHV